MRQTLCLLLAALLCLPLFAVAETAAPLEAAAPLGACPGLAVTGALVWQIADGEVLCQRPETGETVARLGVNTLLSPTEVLAYQGITSWTEDSVMLLLGLTGDGEGRRAALIELTNKDGAVCVRNALDASSALGFLFGDSQWIEIDAIGCGERLFIAAMDARYAFHFHVYTPGTNTMTPLGERPLEAFHAAIPYGDDPLLAVPAEDDSLLSLMSLSLDDGATRLMRTVPVDSARRLFNFAYSDEEKRLYFTSNGTVYALNPSGEAAPEVVGAMDAVPAELRLGAVTHDRFIVHAELPGQLLSCTLRSRTEAAPLRVFNPVGEAVVYTAAGAFGVANPAYAVSVTENGDEADALAALQSGTASFDACVLRLNGDAYRAMREGDLLAKLSDSTILSDAIADMPARLQDALISDGALLACPVSVTNACQLLNIRALERLAGCSRDALPTDWVGFFDLLKQLADRGALIGSDDYCLYDGALPSGALREMLFSWMLQDCFLWLDAKEGTPDALAGALTPVLEAFNAVPWDRLGLPEEGADTAYGSGFEPATGNGDVPPSLILDGALEIAEMPLPECYEFWPLSLEPGGARLIAQNVSAICVSPDSPHVQAATAFVEYLWNNLDAVTRASLCQSMNAPVLNPDYDDDLAYLQQSADLLRQDMDAAQSAGERAQLGAELADLEAYLDDYRENARWLISEASVARYRAQANRLQPTASDAWFTDAVAGAMFEFLNGQLTSAGFALAVSQAR